MTTESLIALREEKVSSRPPKAVPEPEEPSAPQIGTNEWMSAASAWLERSTHREKEEVPKEPMSFDFAIMQHELTECILRPLEDAMGPRRGWSCKAFWKAVADLYWHSGEHKSAGPPYISG